MKISIKKYASALAESLMDKRSPGEKEFSRGAGSRYWVGDPAERGRLIENFLKLLQKKKKTRLLKRFYEVFKNVWFEKNNQIEVTATVPHELKDDGRKSLMAELSGVLGKEVILNVKVDAKVIGGIRLEMGDYIVDGTVKKNLEMLKSKLAYS